MSHQRVMKTLALAASFGMAATAAVSAGTFSVSGPGGPLADLAGAAVYPGTFPTGPSVFSVTVVNPVLSISSVKIQGLSHTWIGDLHAVLRDPAGNGHNLFVRPGYLNTTNFGNSGDFLGGDYTFVDPGTLGALSLPTSTAPVVNPPAGTYQQAFGVGAGAWPPIPAADNNSLSTVSGMAGVWTLTMYDWGAGDVGSITGWMLSGTDRSPVDVSPGSDLFNTPAGGSTFEDFSGMPIPPGFFGPGSDPFAGIVQFQGRPLEGTPSSGPGTVGLPGQADTIVRRMSTAMLPACPSSSTVPIELVALNLVSVQPITVTYFGGAQPTKWEVHVAASSNVPQQPGQMTVRKTHANGGTFDSFLPVQARFVFTQCSNFGGPGIGSMIADPGPQLAFTSNNASWAYGPLGLPVMSSPGGIVDHDSNPATLPVPYPATDNFVPGVLVPGADCINPGLPPVKDMNSEMAMLAAHGVGPPCRPPGIGYAFGDGTGTPCPCINGLPGHGCENSAATGGALLYGSGTASAAADMLVLRVESLPATSSGLFFAGPNPFVPVGMGGVAGDGLSHLGAGFVRFGTKFADCGKVSYGAPIGDPSVYARVGSPGVGTITYIQFFYRNAAVFCLPATFNTTNGYAVTWL